MGVLSDLIAGTKSEVDTQTLPLMSEEQQALLKQLLGFLGEGQGELGEEPGANLETMSLAGLERLLGGEEFSGLFGEARGALSTALSGEPSDFDEFFETSIKEPLLETFREDISPDITRRFAPSGFYSSDRLRQEEQSREDLLTQLTRSRSELGFRTRESAKQRALQAAGLVPGIEAAPFDILKGTFGVGGARRRERITAIMQALGLRPFENIAEVTPGMPGLLQGVAGGVGQGFGSFLGGKVGGGGGGGGGGDGDDGGGIDFGSIFGAMLSAYLSSGCWVAMVLYGVNAGETHTIRAYVHRHLHDRTPLGIFCRRYMRHGRQWAKVVAAFPTVRMVAEVLWDRLYVMAVRENAQNFDTAGGSTW